MNQMRENVISIRVVTFALLILFIFSLFFITAVSASGASIVGSVKDIETNEPVVNATVIVSYSVNETTVATNRSDNMGTFQVLGLSSGTYLVTIEAVGYNNKSEQIQVTEGQTFDLYVLLEPLDSGKGDEAALSPLPFYLCYQAGLVVTIALVVSLVMYSKIKRDNLLNNAIRKRILDHIKENPGKHYRAILADLDLSMGVLSYHLNKLEKAEYIKSRQDGMFRRFYITGPKTEMRFFLSEIQEKILNEIKENRGISQSNIARKIGVSRVVVNYHIHILDQAGFIFVESHGRESACYPRGN